MCRAGKLINVRLAKGKWHITKDEYSHLTLTCGVLESVENCINYEIDNMELSLGDTFLKLTR